MIWKGFEIEGIFKDLSHLNPFHLTTDIYGDAVELEFKFSSHCFSDEKAQGQKLPFHHEERYWSEERYEASLNLPTLIKERFLTSHAVPFRSQKREQYYYTETYDYVIFFDVRKPSDQSNKLKVHIVSAYEKDTWGKLPNGKATRIHWILTRRYKGLKVL